MAKEGDDSRIAEEAMRAQRQEEYQAQQARRNDAQMVCDRILDPRMSSPELAWLTILPWMETSVVEVSPVSDYEAGPIKRALLLRAIGGNVDAKRMEYVSGFEAEMHGVEIKPDWISAMMKVRSYEMGLTPEMEPLTLSEQTVWAEYETARGNRDVVLEMMTNGVYGAVQRVNFLDGRIRALQVRRDMLASKAGDLNPRERIDFESYYAEALEEMSGAQIRSLGKLRGEACRRELTIEEEVELNQLLGVAESILETKAVGKGEQFRLFWDRSGNLTDADREVYENINDNIDSNLRQLIEAQVVVAEKVETLGGNSEWMVMYKAFCGMVANVNTTEQWMKAWHDVGQGSIGLFTETRWTEYQRPSELLAMCEAPGIGPAFREAFRVLVQVGLNDTVNDGEVNWNVGGVDNIYQSRDLTESQLEAYYARVAKTVAYRVGLNEGDYFVRHAVEQARMLFENSGCAPWFMTKRERSGVRAGEIVYVHNGRDTSDFASEAYRYGMPSRLGDGSGYGDRQNDYIKIWATRAKFFASEFAKGFPTGLPALMPVLPDQVMTAWFSHENLVAIADGSIGLDTVFRRMPENSRWSEFMYPLFRAGGLVDAQFTKLPVAGLKGYRSAAEEVEYYLHNPAQLSDLNKRIMAAGGLTPEEKLRLKINVFMALRYAVYVLIANPDTETELKSIIPDSELGKDLPLAAWENDDFYRIFVKTGFLDEDVFKLAWLRFRTIYKDQGGRIGLGMVKRSESTMLARYCTEDYLKSLANKRRQAIADQV